MAIRRTKAAAASGKASAKPPARGSKRPRRKGHGWLLRLLFIGIWLAAVLGIYMKYLDGVVQIKFAGKLWSVPAHVYARPLELFPGARVPLKQIVHEVKELGYRAVAQPTGPGSYSQLSEQSLSLHTRGFAFWDGAEPARQIQISFDKKGVQGIRDANGAELPLVRLEPVQIGSINTALQEDRVLLRYEELPKSLVAGILASEDRDFFKHHGVSPKGISRAMMANVRAGRTVQGGSTLTQQLVKNFFLTREKSLKRKINEALMALLVDYRYSKQEILQAYANEIYLGQDGQRAIHGFGLAARYFFNQPLKELSLKDQALLIALIRGPSYYNPVRHPQRAMERRNLILDLMAENGVLEPAKAEAAKQAPLGLKISRNTSGGNKYPSFMDLVTRQLSRDYREEDLNSEGLRIFTTLDPWVQTQAQEAVMEQLAALEAARKNPLGTFEGSLVIVGRDSGEVQALVGGRQPEFAGFNRAIDSVRPIGSLAKPPVYLAALAMPELYSLVTPISDEPYTLTRKGMPPWSPKNFDHKSHGQPPLYKALAQSYNQATVRLGMNIGINEIAKLMRELGVMRPFPVVPAMLLGPTSLSPLDVTQMYQTIGSGGYRTPLRTIREILDKHNKPLSRYPLDVRQAVAPGAVYLLSIAMQRVVSEGTSTSLSKWLPREMGVAGKTGTTDELRDTWFAGFTGDRVAVAWLGRDDNSPTGLTGASGALQVWGNAMSRISPEPLELVAPDGILFAQVECSSEQMPFMGGVPIDGACGTGESSEDGVFDERPGGFRKPAKSAWSNPWELP